MLLLRSGLFTCAVVMSPFAMAEDALTGQEMSKIEAVLASLNCRASPETVKKQGEDFVLSDAFCADGQFDIRLNSLFKVISKQQK